MISTMNQLLKMALRDLGRNKRRSILSALAVSIATTLLIFMASIVRGEFRGALQNGILLQTGHLQVRSATYEESKVSLAWEDLVDNPAQIADQLKTLPQVVDATPRLLASGIISLSDNSRGVQVLGIDPNAEANQIFRQGVISGEFLTSDDREGILIGKPLADKFNLNVGDQVNLLINTSNGDVDEQAFTVRGIYTTNVFPYDENTVFMPLAKAQAFAGAEDHASLIFVLLNDQDQTESVAAALSSSNYQIVTWQELNELSVEFEQFAGAYMVILYLIILGITATVVTNTLVMAVYERTREIGVLSAIGMKGGRIMLAFLTEAALLATGGVVGGLLLGGLVTLWVGSVGMTVPATQGITGILIGDKIYPFIIASDVISLTVTAYVITLMASLYPALLAARMEPVEALHAQ